MHPEQLGPQEITLLTAWGHNSIFRSNERHLHRCHRDNLGWWTRAEGCKAQRVVFLLSLGFHFFPLRHHHVDTHLARNIGEILKYLLEIFQQLG